jgi:hypothetical protein
MYLQGMQIGSWSASTHRPIGSCRPRTAARRAGLQKIVEILLTASSTARLIDRAG